MSQFHPYPEPRLTVELVPSTQWEKNLRSILSKGKWDELRKACYTRANNRCEVCNGVGHQHPVECHEIWDYDDRMVIQKLMGLIALCPSCHKVKHIGFAMTQGKAMFVEAITHLAFVNEWPIELAIEYVDRQFKIHHLRSHSRWLLDLSWLDKANDYIDETADIARQARKERTQATLANMTRNDSAKERIALKTHDRASPEGD